MTALFVSLQFLRTHHIAGRPKISSAMPKPAAMCITESGSAGTCNATARGERYAMQSKNRTARERAEIVARRPAEGMGYYE